MSESTHPNPVSAALWTTINDCFNDNDGSVDMEKYIAHASEVFSHQWWVTDTIMVLIPVDDLNACPDHSQVNASREPKKHAPQCIWAHRLSEDGPLEVIKLF